MENEKTGICPLCEMELSFEKNVLEGELVTCKGCGAELEVSAVSQKVQLSTAPEVQEDWGE